MRVECFRGKQYKKKSQTWGLDYKVKIISHNKTHGARQPRSSMPGCHRRGFLGALALSQGAHRSTKLFSVRIGGKKGNGEEEEKNNQCPLLLIRKASLLAH